MSRGRWLCEHVGRPLVVIGSAYEFATVGTRHGWPITRVVHYCRKRPPLLAIVLVLYAWLTHHLFFEKAPT